MSAGATVPAVPEGDVIVRVGSKLFRCSCGCNVFRHPQGKPDTYQCNGCASQYVADE